MTFTPRPTENSKPALEVEVVSEDVAVICLPTGNLDATTVTTFGGAIALCVGEPSLIIDLSGLQFIDGAGLTALVGGVRRAQGQLTRVAVVAPAGRIRRVLDAAGLEQIAPVLDSLELARADLRSGTADPGKLTRLVPSERGGEG